MTVPGVAAPVGPTTTVAGAYIANLLKVRVAELLADQGASPPALASSALVGEQNSRQSFDDALADHARRMAAVDRA